jgi:hypothetical protein
VGAGLQTGETVQDDLICRHKPTANDAQANDKGPRFHDAGGYLAIIACDID